MNEMTASEVLRAIDEGLAVVSRWERLLIALKYDPAQGRPGLAVLKSQLRQYGFDLEIPENESGRLVVEAPYPDQWWPAVAQAVTGHGDATADEVIGKLRKAQAVA